MSPKPVVRVAVVSFHSSPTEEPGSGDAGGMTVYVRRLGAALADLGMSTDIFTRATSPDARLSILAPGVRVVPIPAGPPTQLPKDELVPYVDEFVTGVRAWSVAQRARFDVVHSHYWQSGLAARSLSDGWGVPFVHSNHTLAKVKNQTLAPGDRPEPDLRIAGELQVIEAADALIASTDEELQHLACLYGAPHDRVKTLAPGVDHGLFGPGDRAAARRELGLGDAPLILCVGRIQPLKGFDLAVRALAQIKGSPKEPHLMFVGGPSGSQGKAEREKLVSLAEASGLSGRVHFVGPQRHDMLPAFYRAADVVAVCSHSESFGFAALEAHACGRAVVGTPVGGLAHIVQHGRSGFLVEDRDPARFAAALQTLLTDGATRKSFEKHAIDAAAGFNWTSTAQEFYELYDCLANDAFPELCVC